jgi:hypothetical protein
MKTITYDVTAKTLYHDIDFHHFKAEKNILIQIFCGHTHKDFRQIVKTIYKELPQALSIGTTTDGEINNQAISVEKTIVSISTFEHTHLKSAHVQGKDCFENGANLTKSLITDKTKLLIFFTDGTTSNGEEFLKGVSSIAPDVVIAGGMAGDNGRFVQTYVSESDTLLEKGAVGVSLNSDILHIQNDFTFNWQPIGLEHRIDKAEGSRVYQIDGMSAVDFYAKYLGDEVADKLPATGIEFPLIIEKNGYKIARAVISKHADNSLSFAGNLTEGEYVKLGFGNAELIMKKSLASLEDIYSYQVETFFIYSCMARRRYMPRFISIEIKPFALSAPTTGFFTYGEFFHKEKSNELLNQALTVVALSEEPMKNRQESIHPKLSKEHSDYATTIRALTHLINKSTEDYAKEAQKVQTLLESQKLFLRYAIHETNTPLSIIMANIELYELEYGMQPHLSNIEAAMKNIYSIFDDLSYLVQKDRVLYPKKVIDFGDYLRSRIEFFDVLVKQMNLTCSFESPSKPACIMINETKLQRIIDNNITNAIKYTKKGENIYIVLKEEGENLLFEISSRSWYIQDKNKVFDAYYRELSTGEGLGLGLNLVKQICEEESIFIDLKSSQAMTTFRYTFLRSIDENFTA